MRALAIVAMCMLACVVYGIAHDQITARICPEYFTIGHPPLVATESPTLLGIAWGIAATWWVGLILGGSLAAAARAGGWAKREVGSLVRPVLAVMLISACCALLFGVVGYLLAAGDVVRLLEPMASNVPAEKHVAFLTDLWAHNASYGAGFLGGIVICYRVLRDRALQAFLEKHPA